MIHSLATRFITTHRTTLIGYIVLMCILTVERVVIPHFYGSILQHLKNEAFRPALRVFVVLILLFLGFQVLDTVLTLLDTKLLPALEAFTRKEFMNTIIDRHRENYRELHLGDITSKLIKLPGNLQSLFYHVKTTLFNHVLTVVITGGYLFYCHWMFGVIYTVTFLLLALIARRFVTHCAPLSYQREATFDATQETLQDLLHNLLSVYNGRTDAHEHRNIQKANDATMRTMQDHMLCGIPYHILFSTLFIVAFAGITWVGIDLYRRKKILLATLVSSFIVTFSVLKVGVRLYYSCDAFTYLYGSIKVVLDYLRGLPRDSSTKATQRVFKGDRGIDIELKNVTFSYPKRPPLLRNVSLTIPRGEHVAMVGSIGSGKSSLAQLLLRLQTHQSGTITFNDINIQGVSSDALRKHVMYVPQHPRLFNRTLWQNIAYGNSRVQPSDVYALMRRLHMHDLANTFRDKMDMSVGKEGGQLSGGQRQVVWLLRALLNREAQIVILDEPTSALDADSRQQIIRAIRELSHGRTLIVITHDDRLLSLVNRVVHIEKGQIVGDHKK